MSETKKTEPVLKPQDNHATGTGDDAITTMDNHAAGTGGGAAAPQDNHATSEPA
ncbi:hypothetical protein [Streptomyces sp. Wb2n-11]|uniref:hypothetical protein n=1 Tax=Streptomyces sp. Wb2n-11 TaxID=1030533 RepID=UPI000B2E9BF9|nr:hypothetical protein [Streptomyces sp. Wb2n-11]